MPEDVGVNKEQLSPQEDDTPQAQSDIRPGFIRDKSLNLISIIIYLILTSIVLLLIWRLTGYHPLQRQAKATPTPALPKSYVLLGSYHGKVYFWDQQAKTIKEYDPSHPNQEKRKGLLKSLYLAARSPSGDKIALVGIGKGGEGVYLLDLMDSEDLMWVTSPERGFPADYSLQPSSTLSWSPDGTLIAFTAFREAKADLFVADADGTEVRRVTYLGADISSITWVDSDTIAFVANLENREAIYLIEYDGAHLRPTW